MGKGYLIDSNVVIGYLDNKITAGGMSFMNGIVNATPHISVITKIEVLRFNSPPEAYKTLIDFTQAATIYDLNNEIVDATIYLCKKYRIIRGSIFIHLITKYA